MKLTTNLNLKKPDYTDPVDIQDINDNMDTVDAALQARVLKTVQVVAGNGLTGGGALDSNKTVTLGTPTTVTNATTNSVTTTGHTHALTLTKADITGLGVPGEDTNTTYTAGAGLALTGTVFSHPTTAGNKHIPTGGTVGQILKNTASGTATWQNETVSPDTITTINGKTGAIAKSDIVALGIPSTDTNTITTINGKTGAISKADIVALGIPASDTNTIYTAGAGLTLTGTVFTPTFGTTVGTVTQGNDSRLSNARTPLAHNHTRIDVTDLGSVAGINTNASTANYLRGDGTWVTPPNTNTTYTEITTAEIDAGTAATLRTITARRIKYLSDKQMPKSGGILENYSEKLVKMTPGYGEVSLDLSEGNTFEITASVNLTFFLSGSINNVAQSFTLIVKQPAAPKSLSFYPTIKWQGGEIPDMTTPNKTYVLTFMTVDGGTTWLGMFGGEF